MLSLKCLRKTLLTSYHERCGMRNNFACSKSSMTAALAHQLDFTVGVDRYVFFRADADTDYYKPTSPITDILNRYMSGVKMTINVKI